jgi:hypothetical protein
MNRMHFGKWGGAALLLSLASACDKPDPKPDPELPPGGNNSATCPGQLSDSITTEKTIGGDCANWVANQTVNIEPSGRLTILPGTTVTFGSGAGLVVNGGSLNAQGTADKRIILTGAQKTRGFWQGVNYHNTNDVQNVLKYVTVEYAGSSAFAFASPAALALSTNSDSATSRVSLENVILQETNGYGLHLGTNALVTSFVNNTLTKNTSGAAEVVPNTAGFLSSNSTYTGNGKDLVLLQGGQVTRDTTWNALGVPYRVQDTVSVENDADLTIAPGASFEFNSGKGLYVEGSLKAEGTAAQRILFTGVQKTRGYWPGINYHNSNSTQNVLKYVTVEYAGSTEAFHAELAGVALTTNSDSAVTTVAISNSILRENRGYGLFFGPNTVAPGFEGNSLTQNSEGAAAVAPNTVHYLRNTSSYTGNATGKDLVKVASDPWLQSSYTWQNLGVPYRLKDLRVTGVTSRLTLQPGVRMEFEAEGSLYIEDAELMAVGTADKRIVFTKEPNAGANWWGINFHNSASVNNRLEYVDISYGGLTQFNFADAPALISLTTNSDSESSSVALSNVTLSSTSGHGIWVGERSSVTACNNVTFTSVATRSNTTSCQ